LNLPENPMHFGRFFDPRHIALTVLGSLDGLRIHREDLEC